MINQHYLFYKLISGAIIGVLFACAPKPKPVPKNDFGLNIIREDKFYWPTIQTDSNKRMVAVSWYVPGIITDLKYATPDNFTRKQLYKHPAAYLRLDAAKCLGNVQEELKTKGLGLKIFDAYRPYRVTKEMWRIVPDERYAANPAKGSGHNRGAAVDLTMIDLATGIELAMPTPFDDFTEKAHHNYQLLDEQAIKNRTLLRTVMEKHGFVALETEWWHYSLPNSSKRFELLDFDFEQMKRIVFTGNRLQ